MQALVSSPSGKLVDAPLNGEFEIKLSGEKSGYKFRIDINTLWDKKGSYDHLDARQRFWYTLGFKVCEIDLFKSDPGFNLDKLKGQYKMTVTHKTDYEEDMQPIITLAKPMVGWEVGDKIIIGRKVSKD